MKNSGPLFSRTLLMTAITLCLQTGAGQAVVRATSYRELSLCEASQGKESQKRVSCEEALKNAPRVKVGMRKAEVLDLLGEPETRLEHEWAYNFWPCTKAPKPGEQKIIGLDVIFSEGVIKEIKYATMDATGPGTVRANKPSLNQERIRMRVEKS